MIKNKNICLIISVAVAVIWMIISIATMTSTGFSIASMEAAEGLGTAIGMALLMPYLIVSSVGAILHTIGGFVYKRGLVLAGLICECVSLLLVLLGDLGLLLQLFSDLSVLQK